MWRSHVSSAHTTGRLNHARLLPRQSEASDVTRTPRRWLAASEIMPKSLYWFQVDILITFIIEGYFRGNVKLYEINMKFELFKGMVYGNFSVRRSSRLTKDSSRHF